MKLRTRWLSDYSLARNPLAGLAVGVFVLSLLLTVLPVLSPAARETYSLAWADLPLIALASVLILVRRPPTRYHRERGFWIALGTGFLCWLVGRVAWSLCRSWGLPIDLVADFFFQVFYVLVLVAVEMDPGPAAFSPSEQRLRRYTLGGGIVLLMSIYIYFMLLPALYSPATYASWKPGVFGTLVLDTYFLLRLGSRYRRQSDPHWRLVYGYLGAAFVLWVITDVVETVFAYRDIAIDEAGHPLDLLWCLPYIPLLVGILVGRRGARDASATPAPAGDVRDHPPAPGGTLLVPYAFALPLTHAMLVITGLIEPILRHVREILLVVVTVFWAGFIYWVHRLILAENRSLYRDLTEASRDLAATNLDLERRVRARTAALEAANLTLANDVAERKRIEQLLRAAETRNQALIKAVPDALVLVDDEGMIQGVFPSRLAPDHLQLAAGAGRRLAEILPAAARTDFESALAQIRRGAEPDALGLVVNGPQEKQYLELRFSRCGESEILIVAQDVTKRLAFEASLQASQKLEGLGVLAGGIAHDFNNLLAGILGNAQLAAELTTDQEGLRRTLATIESAAQRAAKLTNNLLAYAGDAHVAHEPLELGRVITEMEPLLAAALPKKSHFEIRLADDDLWIEGNEAQITQILLNLVRNAAESLAAGSGGVVAELGRVTIEDGILPGVLQGGPTPPGDYVSLRVRDTGCGMDLLIQQRIFDPFFTTKGSGRGLGLAAVLGIVNQHKGTLTLDSTPGRGTEFSVFFPACRVPVRHAPAAAVDQDRSASGRVLVADDERDVRELITTFLERRGFTTLTAANGTEAVKAARVHSGALAAIILDYAMPELTGAEAFQVIRENDPLVPIIMMSGFGERAELQHLQSRDRTRFIGKPFDLSDLSAAIGDLVDQST